MSLLAWFCVGIAGMGFIRLPVAYAIIIQPAHCIPAKCVSYIIPVQARGARDGKANGQGNGQANGQGNDQANGQGNGHGNGQANGQGNGQANGQGNGQANGQGNGQANGQGNGQANGQGNGQANGQGNGQANGQGNGQANGQGNGQANGQDNGQANGQGNGQANGQGNGQANGQGNGQANSVKPVQSVAATAAKTVATQIQNLLEQEIEPRDGAGANFNSALSGVYQQCFRDGLSVFTLSGISRERHDGFTVTSPAGSFQGTPFETLTYGLTAGARWDASHALGLERSTLVVGGFGNVSSSDLKVGGDGEQLIGEGAIRSYALGAYSLFNSRPFYMLGIASHSWAHADLNSPIDGADASPDSRGYLLSGNIGALVPAGSAVFDLRVGATFAQGQIEDFRNSAGIAYTDADLSDTSGSASAKLLFRHQAQWATLRPFVQVGITQRFDESNKVLADGVPHNFHDADFSVFGRVGVDISRGDSFQAYVAVQGEKSKDRDGIAGQVGFTLELD
jgi:hypothetical protein